MAIELRQASMEDAEVIAQFNEAMALETEGLSLPPERIRAGVRALLDHPERGFYILATVDGAIAASLMVTFEWSDWRCGTFWWIQSVYVVPARRRQGLYTKLHNHVRDLARQTEDICGFRLYAEHDNHPAHATYERCGMQRSHYVMFESVD